jgi:DNA-binding ferritin-like protein
MEKEFVDVLTCQNNLAGAAQLAHWNSEGIDFYQFHILFERVYETASAKIDVMAEQARGKGVQIPAKIFNDVPEIEWSNCSELAKEIRSLVDDLCSDLDKLHKKADEENEYGVLNVVEDIMSDCNTLKYLLGSVNSEF